jgi:hypothetical protein
MEAWMGVELNYMRTLRHPYLGSDHIAFAGAGRRDPGQGGQRDLLVGLRDGSEKPTVARRGSESPSRRPTDPCSTTASVRLWPVGEDLAGERRALKLQRPGSETLPQAASYRQGRPSEARATCWSNDRPGHKALPTPPSGPGWLLWRAVLAPEHTSSVRLCVECGWLAVATTCYGGTALSEKSAPRRWQRGLPIIAGRWRSC